MKFTDIFYINDATFVFTLANTGIILLLYTLFLHKPVLRMLEQRKAAVKTELDAAAEAKEKANSAEKEYLALLANSKAEADKIISVANKRALEREDEIIANAKKDAATLHQKAAEDIERERKRALNEIKDQITDIVVMAASAVAEKEITAADNAKLIDSFLAKA